MDAHQANAKEARLGSQFSFEPRSEMILDFIDFNDAVPERFNEVELPGRRVALVLMIEEASEFREEGLEFESEDVPNEYRDRTAVGGASLLPLSAVFMDLDSPVKDALG